MMSPTVPSVLHHSTGNTGRPSSEAYGLAERPPGGRYPTTVAEPVPTVIVWSWLSTSWLMSHTAFWRHGAHSRAHMLTMFWLTTVAAVWADSLFTVTRHAEFRMPLGCPAPVPLTIESPTTKLISSPATRNR